MSVSQLRPGPTGQREPGAGFHERHHPFRSILFGDAHPPVGAVATAEPDFFADLNLDQVLEALTRGREPYDLRPFFCTTAHSIEQVRYRQDVLDDLQVAPLADSVRAFAEGMRSMRERLATAATLRNVNQRSAWMLDAVGLYCAAVQDLAEELTAATLHAVGWHGLRDFLTGYVRSAAFTALRRDVDDLCERLAGIEYCVRILGADVTVSRYAGQEDYSAAVLATFEKFRQADVAERRFRITRFLEMNHVETAILDRVALLYPEIFSPLQRFPEEHRDFLDETVALFDREVQFYLAYLELIDPLRAAGLPFCRAEVYRGAGDLEVRDTFDLALALTFVPERQPVVGNDVALGSGERLVVVTGPNQGGKTTLARTFGQLHHLAALGLPVPGTSARLPLVDRVFTQFERGENRTDLSGKLADDLTRIRGILEHATERSVVIVNEIFTSTSLEDARYLGRKVMGSLIGIGCLGAYVTFVDELASLGPEVVSMVSTVDPEDPARRTYRVVRRPADGLAYADVLAAKYGLTYDRLASRIGS